MNHPMGMCRTTESVAAPVIWSNVGLVEARGHSRFTVVPPVPMRAISVTGIVHRPRLKWARLAGHPFSAAHGATTITRKYAVYIAAVAPPTIEAVFVVKTKTGTRPSAATSSDAAHGAPSLVVRVHRPAKGSCRSRDMPKICLVAPANMVLVAINSPSATAHRNSFTVHPGRCTL